MERHAWFADARMHSETNGHGNRRRPAAAQATDPSVMIIQAVGGVSSPLPSARCIITQSTQLPDLYPTA